MSARARWLFGLLILVMGAVLVQVTVAAQSPGGNVKYVSAKAITNPDGAVVYQDYCAVCHGVLGRGDGPAAKFLDTPVPDLSRIAIRDGRFNRFHVIGHVRHDAIRGDSPMPCWQRTLRSATGYDARVEVVMVNLTDYLERLQVAP